MRFTKIAHSKDETELEWDESVGEHDIVHSKLKSGDRAEEAFGKAMDALTSPVLELLEIPASYETEGVHVTSLSIQHKGEMGQPDNERGLVVSVRRPIEATNAPFMIHTPHVRESQGEENETIAELFRLADKVIDQAQRFIDGHRAQMDMFDETAPDKAASEAEVAFA